MGELNGVEYAGEIEALKGRIRDLVSKAKSLLEMDLPSAASSKSIAASDWSDFIKLASLEIQGFEKIVRGVEDATKVEERLKSVLLLWRKATSGPVSPALVEMLSSLRKFKFAFLHSDKSTVSDLRKAVQGQC
ncbi:MAG: hypothetical protein QFX35_06225, partial [Candidatus Verstraetearchaeota archaeon]|nr:hypothetical protein [Candidatus Verstraetearchaeota archaeon]